MREAEEATTLELSQALLDRTVETLRKDMDSSKDKEFGTATPATYDPGLPPPAAARLQAGALDPFQNDLSRFEALSVKARWSGDKANAVDFGT